MDLLADYIENTFETEQELENVIRKHLKIRIDFQIKCDLTIGRDDNDLQPFSENKISDFIKRNINRIDTVIDIMITEYKNDNELEDLLNPEPDWIREYLYDHISNPDV